MSVEEEDCIEIMEATRAANPLQNSILKRDAQRSAFTPYKSATLLTNLQRGNVQAKTPDSVPERSVHQLAAQGELFEPLVNDMTEIDPIDERGYTPLIWAASYGQITTVRLLLDRNANVNHRSPSGESALHFASSNGHVQVVKELIGKNADPNFCDEEGNTPLIYAAFQNQPSCVTELLNGGADLTLDNNNNETAYTIAVSKDNEQVQRIIERFMLDHVMPSATPSP
ncbi:DNA-binding protein RFXANK [Halotydeus destructor]|nr:DNA-binding protein RFXANK [Halotydeus destructor]